MMAASARAIVLILLAGAPFAHAAVGTPDTTYGVSGLARLPTGLAAGDELPQALIDSAGRAVFVGNGQQGGFGGAKFDLVVGRVTVDGQRDKSFSGDGLFSTAIEDVARGQRIAELPDGRLVVAGVAEAEEENGVKRAFLLRLLPNGTLDQAFGAQGRVVGFFPNTFEVPGLAVRPDGAACFVAALGTGTDPKQVGVGCVSSTGDGLGSFGPGTVVSLGARWPLVLGGGLDGAGRPIAFVLSDDGARIGVLRLTTSGQPDVTNGPGGLREIAFAAPIVQDFAQVVARPGGGWFVVGSTADGDVPLALDADAMPESGYGSGGFGAAAATRAFAATVDLTGRLVTYGRLVTFAAALVRWTANGIVDTSFAASGAAAMRGGGGALAIQNDLRIVFAGNGGDFVDFYTTRILGDCGNGILQAGESCDDDNGDAGDCCSHTCAFEPAESACDADGDLCSTDVCDGAGGCAPGTPGPLPTCTAPSAARASSLVLSSSARSASWKWSKGPVTPMTAFGAPDTTTDYALCVWDTSAGTPSLALQLDVPAGGTCGVRPCWLRKGNTPGTGIWTYKTRGDNPDGVTTLQIKEGLTTGRPKITFKAKGTPPASLPFDADPAVTVELRSSEGACFGGTLGTPARNDAGGFSAKMP